MHLDVRNFAGRGHLLLAALICLAWASAAGPVRAELPLARLAAIFPAGAQRGTRVEVTLNGPDLDGANRLLFSRPGISATPIPAGAGAAPGTLKFLIAIDSSVPPDLYDVRAVGLFGVTNPRSFEVGDGACVSGHGGNATVETATELPVGSSVYALAESNVNHFYRVAVERGQRLTVDVVTTALDSRMEPITVVSDAAGRELARSRRAGEAIRIVSPIGGVCTINVHDLLYRAGPEYFYRLRVTDAKAKNDASEAGIRWPVPPAAAFLNVAPLVEGCDSSNLQGPEPDVTNRDVQPPCEIVGQFRSVRQRDGYRFDAPAGATYWIEIDSHRLGQDTSPFLLVQRVDRDQKGVEKFVDVQEVNAPPVPVAVPEFPLNTRDPIYRLEVKQAGSYRLLVRDLFARDREIPAAYRLSIRHESPDFALVAVPPSPLPDPADSKDVPVWTTLLRRGGTAPIKVIAGRRDGFAGEIALRVDGLPPGITAGPAVIPEGSNVATIVLQARSDAQSWAGPIAISGVGHGPSGDLCRTARAGGVSFSTYKADAKTLVLLRSRVSDQFVIAVSSVEETPISITPKQSTFEAAAGGKVSLSFDVASHLQFVSPMTLNLAGHPLTVKQLTVDPKSNKATVELDLSQTKLPPGRYTLHFVGQAKLKYPDSPALRAARIAWMDQQPRDAEMTPKIVSAAEAVGQACKLKDGKLLVSSAKSFIVAEANWIAARQADRTAEARAFALAVYAPAKEVTISIYTGAFELNVAPAAGK